MAGRGTVAATWRWDKAYIVAQGGGQALRQVAEDLGRKAQQEVPISAEGSHGQAPGFLRDSMVIRGYPRWKWMAEVAYTAWYSTIVHERTDLRHERGRAKWLELAAIERAPKVEATVRSSIERAERGLD